MADISKQVDADLRQHRQNLEKKFEDLVQQRVKVVEEAFTETARQAHDLRLKNEEQLCEMISALKRENSVRCISQCIEFT